MSQVPPPWADSSLELTEGDGDHSTAAEEQDTRVAHPQFAQHIDPSWLALSQTESAQYNQQLQPPSALWNAFGQQTFSEQVESWDNRGLSNGNEQTTGFNVNQRHPHNSAGHQLAPQFAYNQPQNTPHPTTYMPTAPVTQFSSNNNTHWAPEHPLAAQPQEFQPEFGSHPSESLFMNQQRIDDSHPPYPSPSTLTQVRQDMNTSESCSVPCWLANAIRASKKNNEDLHPLDLIPHLSELAKTFESPKQQKLPSIAIENIPETNLLQQPLGISSTELNTFLESRKAKICSTESEKRGPLKCINTRGCPCSFGIGQRTNWKRHYAYRRPYEAYRCPVERCKHLTHRLDHMKRHLQSRHKDLQVKPEIQKSIPLGFKRQCGFCPKEKKAFEDIDEFLTHFITEHIKKGANMDDWEDHDGMMKRSTSQDHRPGLTRRRPSTDDGDGDEDDRPNGNQNRQSNAMGPMTAKRARVSKADQSQAPFHGSQSDQVSYFYYEDAVPSIIWKFLSRSYVSSSFLWTIYDTASSSGISKSSSTSVTSLDEVLNSALELPIRRRGTLSKVIEEKPDAYLEGAHSFGVLFFLNDNPYIERIRLGRLVWQQNNQEIPRQGIAVETM